MMNLTKEQKKELIAQSHKLHPVVMIGSKGLTEAVNIEIERALESHGLIKIKVAGTDREARNDMFTTICNTHHAELINSIGFIGTFYRRNDS